MVESRYLKELRQNGSTDVPGEISINQLRVLARALAISESNIRLSAGPCETIRINVPTAPKRTTQMGEIDAMGD